jgi:hypothetical protein
MGRSGLSFDLMPPEWNAVGKEKESNRVGIVLQWFSAAIPLDTPGDT